MTDHPTRRTGQIVHGACGATWTAAGATHCSGCHRTFSGIGLFDRHRKLVGDHGVCLDPAALVDGKTGKPLAEHRDGMWRYPEMDEATKLARFGRRPAA